jgi:hypothetical protein
MKAYSKAILSVLFVVLLISAHTEKTLAANVSDHDHKEVSTQHPHAKPDTKASSKALLPAEGASVKILTPKNGQTVKGDQVEVHFKLVKGKQGEHVHAYVDGELMGMFKSEKGTLNGIQPGTHSMELRVVTKDHETELNATDRVRFTVK